MPLPAILGALGGAGSLAAGGAGRAIAGAVTGDMAAVAKGLSNIGTAAGAAGSALKPALSGLQSFGNLSFNLQYASQSIKGLAGSVAALPSAPIRAFSAAINLIQSPVIAATNSLKGFVAAVSAVGSSITDFIQLISPVHVLKFNIAVEDLMASIGMFLIPVMENSTEIVRAFADVINAVAGPLARLTMAFVGPFTEAIPRILAALTPSITLFNEFASTMAFVLEPVVRILVQALEGILVLAIPTLMPVIIGLVGALVNAFLGLAAVFGPIILALAAVGQAFEILMDALGLKSVAGRSVGTAVRPATIGSVEDYGRKAIQAAFTLGSGAEKPDERSASALEKIYNYLTGPFLTDIAQRFPELAAELAKAMLRGIPGGETAGDIIKAGAEAPRDVGRWVDRKLDAAADTVAKWATGLGL